MEHIFSPVIEKAADQLNLNLWGKISLTIYCDGAIEHGLKQCKLFKDAKDPYKYFMSQAKSYSNTEQIPLRWSRCYDLQKELGMPDDVEVFTNAPKVEKIEPTKFYSHKETQLDYDNECAKWHDMVVNWDKITDPKKKCAKGFELTYPHYKDWLAKQSLTTLLDQDLPDTLLYIDESKMTLLDAMRK